jgi:hypothetical protein
MRQDFAVHGSESRSKEELRKRELFLGFLEAVLNPVETKSRFAPGFWPHDLFPGDQRPPDGAGIEALWQFRERINSAFTTVRSVTATWIENEAALSELAGGADPGDLVGASMVVTYVHDGGPLALPGSDRVYAPSGKEVVVEESGAVRIGSDGMITDRWNRPNLADLRRQLERNASGTARPSGKFLAALRRYMAMVSMSLMGLGLLGTTAVALCVGFEDLFSPVSIAGQLLGLVFFLAGLVGLAGLAGLVNLAGFVSPAGLVRDVGLDGKPLSKTRISWGGKRDKPPTWQISSVFGGAVAGCYINIVTIHDSLGYPVIITRIFGYTITMAEVFIILEVLCLYLACVMLPALSVVWKYLANGVKGLGLTAALLGLAAQFWYVSVYVPDNTPIGISYAVSTGAMSGSGSDRQVQVDLSMEDVGAVAAIVLDSMIVINGISYPGGSPTLLGVQPAFGDTGFLFPGESVQYDFVVNITKSTIKALKFELMVDFARTSWLAISKYRGDYYYLNNDCVRNNLDTQKEWYIAESHVHYFTRGAMVVYSDYCEYPTASATAPYIHVGIAGVRGGKLVSIPDQSPVGSDLGILQSVRTEMIILG